MSGPVKLTLATASRDGTRIATQLIEHSSGLTVIAVTDLSPLPESGAVSKADCIVAIVDGGAMDAPALYETFRQQHPTKPLVIVTPTDERAFIESLLDDEHGDYAHLSVDGVPFGLLSARCKRLVKAETARQ